MAKILRDESDYPYHRTTLYNQMKSMGFRHAKLKGRNVVKEQNRVIESCRKYLKLVRKYRMVGHPIVYSEMSRTARDYTSNSQTE